MAKRLKIDNPFYDNDASASAFGWAFQVDAAIFLFLKYLEEVKSIKVEGTYQDIEILCKDNHHIFAQAKSIQDGSIRHRMEKLDDAVISLVKTPASANDELLYVSNYSAPLKDDSVFRNRIVALKDERQEQTIVKEQIDKLINKIEVKINVETDTDKKNKYEELKRRLGHINLDDFLVTSIYPYGEARQAEDKYRVISETLQSILTSKFYIESPYITRYVSEILLQWHETFLYDATLPTKSKNKTMSKIDLLWQIVVILSKMEVNMTQLFDIELDSDQISEYEDYDAKTLFIHERFKFTNKLYDRYKEYLRDNQGNGKVEFIKEVWTEYIDEYFEFKQYDQLAQEYLIKKSLFRLLDKRNNIRKIISGR